MRCRRRKGRGTTLIGRPPGVGPAVKPRAQPPDQASRPHAVADDHGVSLSDIASAQPANIAVLRILNFRENFVLLFAAAD
jgi:hypothetical protein